MSEWYPIKTTPLHYVNIPHTPEFGYGIPCFFKLEGYNATGSMKIRSAYRILREAQLPVGAQVVESTSGNMGAALAHCCKHMGLHFLAVTDPKLSPYHERIILSQGACISKVHEVDKTGGWLLTRLEEVKSILEKVPDAFWVNQYSNPWNPIAFESIGIEIVKQLQQMKNCAKLTKESTIWFFAAVSTGGSISGAARALRRLVGRPDCKMLPTCKLRVVAVDVEGSAIFGRPAQARLLNGIGSSLAQPPNLQRKLIDEVAIVTDEQAFEACFKIRRDEDLWVGGSSGAVWAAIEAWRSCFKPEDIVVGVFPDTGWIYEETIYNDEWRTEHNI